jgi:hypothetical protein
MKHVEFHCRHRVQQKSDVGEWDEVACDVEKYAAVAEERLIGNESDARLGSGPVRE